MKEQDANQHDDTGEEEDGEEAFRIHLGTYLSFGVFFFVLNLLTSRGTWWFYWPMFGWGIGLAAHALVQYGPAAPWMISRIIASWMAQAVPPLHSPPQPHTVAPTRGQQRHQEWQPVPESAPHELRQVIAESETKVDAMRRQARLIPKAHVRDQALAICAAADRILSVLPEATSEQQLARDFLNRYLTPAEAIFAHYARLSSRGVTAAETTLAKVESEDLPLLDRKMTELYNRLHRGDLIDLEVAREMLALDFVSAPAPSSARAESPYADLPRTPA